MDAFWFPPEKLPGRFPSFWSASLFFVEFWGVAFVILSPMSMCAFEGSPLPMQFSQAVYYGGFFPTFRIAFRFSYALNSILRITV